VLAVYPPLNQRNRNWIVGVARLVPVDGQVPVRVEVTGEEVANPAG
jgi:hypothetical protein